MKREELEERGCLVPMNVIDACQMYEEEDVTGTRTELEEFLRKLVMENGAENTYFDFYYGALLEEEQQRIREKLTAEECTVLENRAFSASREEVYFAYDEELFGIAIKLSLNSYLFSTFYFARTGETVWTNYENRFLVFRRK